MKVELDKKRLLNGIKTVADTVGSTLGAEGAFVAIKSQKYTHGLGVTKDGVSIAKSIAQLDDPIEAIGAQIIIQSATETMKDVGDNTTTSVVIANELIQKLESSHEDISKIELLKQVDRMSSEVIQYLNEVSEPVTDLLNVATVSANNDSELGLLIKEAYDKVGTDGAVTVEKNYQTPDTYVDVAESIELDGCGYTSKGLVNTPADETVVYKKTKVFIYDGVIEILEDLKGVLDGLNLQKTPLTIVADMNPNLAQTMIANVMRNGMKINIVSPPPFGYRRQDLLKDLAFLTGATYFYEGGDDLSMATDKDLGLADKVISSSDKTVFYTPDADRDALKGRVTEIKDAIKKEGNLALKNFMVKRVAYLNSGLARIYVGGKTDQEMKEKYDRVDDAVLACRAALDSGILSGGGVALRDAYTAITFMDENSEEEQAADVIMYAALNAPFNKILSNAWMNDMVDEDYEIGFGVDVRTGTIGDMKEMGIIDTLIGIKTAFESAVSVAKTVYKIKNIVY